MDPNASPSDILDSVQSISEAVSEMGGSLNWEFIADYEDPMELLANAIDKVSKEYAESVLSGDGFGQMLANNIIQAQRLKAELDSYNTTTDSIQSAFKSLTSAVEEYNQNGYLTADTLQTIMSLDSQYLACLINENGQLQINGQTYEALVQAKLADAQATAVKQAMAELDRIATEQQMEADVASIGTMAEKEIALGSLASQYGHLTSAAISATAAQALADSYADASGKNQEAADQVMASLDAKLALIQDTMNATAGSFSNLTNHLNGFSSASGKASKATDELTEAMQSQKDALEAQKDALQKQVEHYEKVIDAINWFYDKQIEKQEKAIDDLEKQNDLLKEQQDNYDMALSAIDRFYQNQIDLIKSEQDAIDERIAALREENDERKEQYELEQKQLALERARNQKTNLTYTADRGYIYTADEVSIKEAEDSLADAELNNAVSKLEKEKDKLQESIDKLEEYRKLWGTVADEYQNNLEDMQLQLLLGNDYEAALLEGRLETVTTFKDNYIAIQSEINSNEELIASYEEKIEYYESLKEEWEDLTSKFEEETYIQLLIGEFGNNYENELLNGRTARWDQFANEYANIQSQLADVTDQIETLTQRMEEYAARMESAASRAISAANQATNVNVGVVSGVTDIFGNSYSKFTYGRAKGGIIGKDDESELDYIARAVGEDHMVALTEGEAVIPVDTVKANPGLVKGLLDADGIVLKPTDVLLSKHPNFDISKFQDVVANIPWNINVKPTIPNFERISNNNTVEINIGDIHLSGVQDVNGLSNAIITKLPNRLLQDLGKK